MENQTANAITLREPMQLTSENVEAEINIPSLFD